MAAPTETYIDPADGAAAGNDHGGNAFIDGVFNSGAPNQLTKIGAFTAATCQAGDKIYLDDNGSGEVTAGLYTISARDDNDNVTLTADIRSGGPEPTDVRCDQHTGVVGLPWATVQHALDFTTRDAANGDRFNVKAGTDDVLASALDFTAYGVPTAATPCIFQGYTAVASDGGIGGISGGGAATIIGNDRNYMRFIDLHLHNVGANYVARVGSVCHFVNVEADNGSGIAIFRDDGGSTYLDCYLHNFNGRGIMPKGQCFISYCTFENGASDFTSCIVPDSTRNTYKNNVFYLDGATIGIDTTGANGIGDRIIGNSIYSSSGTGTGIEISAGTVSAVVLSNILEGFSGVGGKGILIEATGSVSVYGFNAFYNNTTNLSNAGDIAGADYTANDINPLGASAFIDAANGDFRVKPSVQALGYPTGDYPNLSVRSYLDIGALQRMSQMLTHPGMAGGARG